MGPLDPWVAYVDPETDRPFFVNPQTSERRWLPPASSPIIASPQLRQKKQLGTPASSFGSPRQRRKLLSVRQDSLYKSPLPGPVGAKELDNLPTITASEFTEMLDGLTILHNRLKTSLSDLLVSDAFEFVVTGVDQFIQFFDFCASRAHEICAFPPVSLHNLIFKAASLVYSLLSLHIETEEARVLDALLRVLDALGLFIFNLASCLCGGSIFEPTPESFLEMDSSILSTLMKVFGDDVHQLLQSVFLNDLLLSVEPGQPGWFEIMKRLCPNVLRAVSFVFTFLITSAASEQSDLGYLHPAIVTVPLIVKPGPGANGLATVFEAITDFVSLPPSSPLAPAAIATCITPVLETKGSSVSTHPDPPPPKGSPPTPLMVDKKGAKRERSSLNPATPHGPPPLFEVTISEMKSPSFSDYVPGCAIGSMRIGAVFFTGIGASPRFLLVPSTSIPNCIGQISSLLNQRVPPSRIALPSATIASLQSTLETGPLLVLFPLIPHMPIAHAYKALMPRFLTDAFRCALSLCDAHLNTPEPPYFLKKFNTPSRPPLMAELILQADSGSQTTAVEAFVVSSRLVDAVQGCTMFFEANIPVIPGFDGGRYLGFFSAEELLKVTEAREQKLSSGYRQMLRKVFKHFMKTVPEGVAENQVFRKEQAKILNSEPTLFARDQQLFAEAKKLKKISQHALLSSIAVS